DRSFHRVIRTMSSKQLHLGQGSVPNRLEVERFWAWCIGTSSELALLDNKAELSGDGNGFRLNLKGDLE
ncbi:1442_t:CDS:2, partial [Gigaspora rosea]